MNMNLPDNLKDLQKLCKDKSLKFKGKTKAQLKEILSIEVDIDASTGEEDFGQLTVKELKAKCEELGLSKYGTKAELVKSLENKNVQGLKVVQWTKRGRKAATRPSETVYASDEESDVEADVSAYDNLKKYELKEICMKRNLPGSGTLKALIKRLVENDALKKQVEKEKGCPGKICESCEENPSKLYETPDKTELKLKQQNLQHRILLEFL